MKYLIVLSLLSMSVTAGAKNGRPFNCVSGSGHSDLLSISACVNDQGNQLAACKGQDPRHLGTAYLNVEKVQFNSGRNISAPVIQTVQIPSRFVSVNVSADVFEIKMQDAAIGTLDVRMPTDPKAENGRKNGRFFYVHANGIEAELESVVCQFRK